MDNFENKWNGLSNPKLDEALKEFDLEQYRKDMEQLNELTSRILKNNPSHVRKDDVEGFRNFSTGKNPDPFKETILPGPEHVNDVMGYINKQKDIKTIRKTLEDQGINFDDKTQSWTMDNTKYHNFKRDEKRKDPKFQKEVDDIIKNSMKNFGNSYVGKELTENIIEVSKEKIVDEMPPLAQDLLKLGMYGVHTVSDNKFDATYLDFVYENTVSADDPISKFVDPLTTIPTIECRLFNSVGRMQQRLIGLNDTRIEVGIKDFINDEFIKKVKELSEKNIDEKITNKLKSPILLNEDGNGKRILTTVSNRISMISNYINVKNRRGPATFILASKKNIDVIIEAFSGWWWQDGKTYKYNKTLDNFRFDLIANDDIGDVVIVGRKPNEGEVGINLVINRNTLTNFVYNEDDITGINLSFDFFSFGKNPEWNYFSFEMKR